MDRIAIVNDHLGGRGAYLEIGVCEGAAFWNVHADMRVGVDPEFVGRRFRALRAITPCKRAAGTRKGSFVYWESSDDFFARHASGFGAFDCVLVDGLHTGEQAFRDVTNALDHLSSDGVVVMHDCNPFTETRALADPEEAKSRADYDGCWNGDVWRALIKLRTRHDLDVKVFDCDHGVGVVRRGEPSSEPLHGSYEDMSYAEFAAERERLLNLVPPTDSFLAWPTPAVLALSDRPGW